MRCHFALDRDVENNAAHTINSNGGPCSVGLFAKDILSLAYFPRQKATWAIGCRMLRCRGHDVCLTPSEQL